MILPILRESRYFLRQDLLEPSVSVRQQPAEEAALAAADLIAHHAVRKLQRPLYRLDELLKCGVAGLPGQGETAPRTPEGGNEAA